MLKASVLGCYEVDFSMGCWGKGSRYSGEGVESHIYRRAGPLSLILSGLKRALAAQSRTRSPRLNVIQLGIRQQPIAVFVWTQFGELLDDFPFGLARICSRLGLVLVADSGSRWKMGMTGRARMSAARGYSKGVATRAEVNVSGPEKGGWQQLAHAGK